MEILIIAGIILVVVGFVGTIIPGVPGVTLSYAGVILLQLSEKVQFSTPFMVGWAVVVVIVQVLDYYLSVWGTKKFGGSRWGVWGCVAGMLVGLFLGPWGIALGPFAGAVIGEMLAGKQTKSALKAGLGAFTGFLLGNVLEITVAGFLLFYSIKAVYFV